MMHGTMRILKLRLLFSNARSTVLGVSEQCIHCFTWVRGPREDRRRARDDGCVLWSRLSSGKCWVVPSPTSCSTWRSREPEGWVPASALGGKPIRNAISIWKPKDFPCGPSEEGPGHQVDPEADCGNIEDLENENTPPERYPRDGLQSPSHCTDPHKDDDRLACMVLDVGVVILDEIQDDPGEPPEHVRHRCKNTLLHSCACLRCPIGVQKETLDIVHNLPPMPRNPSNHIRHHRSTRLNRTVSHLNHLQSNPKQDKTPKL
mmetsp:Transcript_17694/g.36716  ORF Transcript_17694/g.36716 Transcript_17694/m.36716 type:complete len:261 (-) Transcript_17694:98-880(-)